MGIDIDLAQEISKGASSGCGGAISVTGVGTVCEREQNVRNEALAAVAQRVRMR